MSATAALREELAHVAVERDCCADAELSGLLRFGGSVTLSDAGVGFALETEAGAVARRARDLLGRLAARLSADVAIRVEVHRPGGLHRATRYRLALSRPAAEAADRGHDPVDGSGPVTVLAHLGVLDGDGRPSDGVAADRSRTACDAAAYARGALMAAGSLSSPGAPAHLEVRAPGETTAVAVARLLVRLGGAGARPQRHGERWRVVVKSGAQVGAVLARGGAHATFLRWDAARLTRELRSDANRAANAERANISRAVAASSRQVAAIDRAVGTVEWSQLPPEVAATALARLANPEASLAELGEMLDPPVGKATVHRRLARLHTPTTGDG